MKYRDIFATENNKFLNQYLQEQDDNESRYQQAKTGVMTIGAGVGGVLANMVRNIDMPEGPKEAPPLFGDESSFFGAIGYYGGKAFGAIVDFLMDIFNNYFVPLAIVVGGAYVGQRVFRRIFLGEAEGDQEKLKGIISREEIRSWNNLQEAIDRRDEILKEITDQELTPEEANERYASEIDSLTGRMEQEANNLLQFMNQYTADDLGLSNRQYRQLTRYLQGAKNGLVSYYIAKSIK